MAKFDNIALPMMQGLDRFAGGLARGFMARGQIEEARRERLRQEGMADRERAAKQAREDRSRLVELAEGSIAQLMGRGGAQRQHSTPGAPAGGSEDPVAYAAEVIKRFQDARLRELQVSEDDIADPRRRQRLLDRYKVGNPPASTLRPAAAAVAPMSQGADQRLDALKASEAYIRRLAETEAIPKEMADILFRDLADGYRQAGAPEALGPQAAPPPGAAPAARPLDGPDPQGTHGSAQALQLNALEAVERARAPLAELLDAVDVSAVGVAPQGSAVAQGIAQAEALNLPDRIVEGMKRGAADPEAAALSEYYWAKNALADYRALSTDDRLRLLQAIADETNPRRKRVLDRLLAEAERKDA